MHRQICDFWQVCWHVSTICQYMRRRSVTFEKSASMHQPPASTSTSRCDCWQVWRHASTICRYMCWQTFDKSISMHQPSASMCAAWKKHCLYLIWHTEHSIPQHYCRRNFGHSLRSCHRYIRQCHNTAASYGMPLPDQSPPLQDCLCTRGDTGHNGILGSGSCIGLVDHTAPLDHTGKSQDWFN
jgi:hypothetical protein